MDTGNAKLVSFKHLGISSLRAIQILFIIFAQVISAVQGPMPVRAAAPGADVTPPQLFTDLADYMPGAVVHVTGSGFAGDTDYALPVKRPDGSIVQLDPQHNATPGWATVKSDPGGSLTYDYQLDGIQGLYEVRAYLAPWSGDWNEAPVALVTFTDAPIQTDYQHWLDLAPGSWANTTIQKTNSSYFEGEVVPHYYEVKNLTAGTTYAMNIFYNYFYQTKNTCGFDYLADYNASRTPTIPAGSVPGTPTADNVFPEGHGSFYTVGADITMVTGPIDVANNIDRYVQVTFTATASSAAFYWGFHLAQPGSIGTCLGAHSWPGASLQTNVADTPTVSGAVMIGGGSTLQINPAGIIAGSVSGVKWNDLNGNGTKDTSEPVLSGWTIQLCSDSACSSILQTYTTDVSGNYTFSVIPGAYYIREVQQTGWLQTAPTAAISGPLTITSAAPTAVVNFGNFQKVSVTACKLKDGDGSLSTTGDQTALSGWPVYLTIGGTRQTPTQSTGSDGCYTWSGLGPGTYGVGEDVQTGMTPLTPTTHSFGSATSGSTYSYTFINQATPAPALSLTKSASPTTYTTSGEIITYTYTLTNTGNVPLTPPYTVLDDKVASVTCPSTPASLDVNSSVQCSGSYTTTNADVTAGSIVNKATATAKYGSTTVTSPQATATVTLTAMPALTLAKSASPTTYDHAGQIITYTYTITNSGNVPLSGPFTVSDNIISPVDCTQAAANLLPGAQTTCTASYTITLANIDAGSVTNTATATNGTITSNQATATITADKKPALTLAKSADPSTYSTVGQTITYTYTITNSGNVTIAGPFSVTDNKVTAVDCSKAAASLAPGVSTTCTGSYTITLADLDTGKVTNTATATNGTVTSPEASATVDAVKAPALTLTKSAAPTTYDHMNQVISYTFVVQNSGNVTLSAPFAVSDNKATDESCPNTPTSLAPGETITCTASYTITQADLDAGSVTNKATASTTYNNQTVTSNEATATVTAEKTPALTLAKSAAPGTYSAVGATITYTYTITNSGNVTISGPFSVTDDKAASVDCSKAAASLAPGASTTCEATYTITQANLDAGSVTNKATATNGTVTSNEATATVTAIQSPAISLAKSAAPATYSQVGDVISYTYVITNTGNVTLSGPFAVSDNKAAVTCDTVPAGGLAPNATLNCTASYSIIQPDLDAGKVTNTATASTSFHNQTVSSAPASATVNAIQSPALSIKKSAQEATFAAAGDVLHYSYVVTNSGNITLHDPITVTDDKITAPNTVTCPALPSGGLLPSASITCTATYTVTQADVDAGKVTNVAYATSGTTQSPTDTVTVNAAQSPALKLEKAASPLTYNAAGQVIGYTYTLTNTGNVTLSAPYAVSDNKATVTCASTDSLIPGGTTSCTASYTTTQTDLDAGSVTNTATATAKFGGADVTSNTAQATVNAVKMPALTLAKSASPGTYSTVGDTITYHYVVTNSGNVTLTSPITISDNKTSVTCDAMPADGLAPLATLNCSATYTITQTDLDAGSLTNTAKASTTYANQPVTSNEASATVHAVQSPGLTFTKQADVTSYSKVGDVITYTLTATNTGNVTLHNVSITDTTLGVLSCNPTQPATLAPAQKLVCTASHTVTQANLDAGSYKNTATSTGTPPGGTPVTPPPAEVIVPANQAPHLSLTKSADKATYSQVGDVITYTLTATNDGNVTLSSVSITDSLLTSLTCTPSQPATLAPTQTLTCTGMYTISLADLNAGKVTNTANASATDTNGKPVNAEPASVTVTANQLPSMTLTKHADVTSYSKVGDVITYTLTAANTGNVTLHNVTITDAALGTLNCTPSQPAELNPGESLVCTGTHTITQANLDAGSYKNTATTTGTPPSGTPITPPPAEVNVPAVQTPSLALSKVATEISYNQVGDILHYTIVATNTGNVTLSAVTITDATLGTLTCTPDQPATLAPAATLTCTGSHTVTQADLDAGFYKNTASATGNHTHGSPVTPTPVDVTVPAVQNPHLTLTKSANLNSYSKTGEVITYTLTATNDGNVTLTSVTITDSSLGALTCTPTQPATLAPTQQLVCTGAHTITQADLDDGSYHNSASVTGTAPDHTPVTPPPAEVTVPAVQSPHITLSKNAAPGTYDAVKQTISYTIVATNDGNVTLSNIQITDAKLGSLTCAQPATLKPGEKLTCTGSHTITQADLDAGSYQNTASVAGQGPQGQPVSNEASATITADQKPHLMLTKSADKPTYSKVGDVITYTLTATNDGNITLSSVSISDSLLSNITCTPLQPAVLAPTEKLVCTGTYTIGQTDLDAGKVTNTANVSATDTNGKPVSGGPASVTVDAVQSPALTLAKQADPTSYSTLGQSIAYTYTVTNSGNVTLHDPITITDNKATVTCDALPAGGLAPNASITCTATYTITQSDLDTGSVTNKATASTTFGGKTVTSNEAQATITAVQSPAISLTKSADKTTYSVVGEKITYTLVATNTGNVTLANVKITDPKLGTLTCTQPVSLAPQATLTCTGTYTVTQADLDTGSITNTATATGAFGGKDYSDSKSLTITATQNPALSLTKSANPTTYSLDGQTITYTYVVKNTGNVTLKAPFSISDDKLGAFAVCNGLTSLAPGASVTCTKTYIIQPADLTVASITNTATATGMFNTTTVTSNQAQATITKAAATGMIAPTQTTCQMFANGTASSLDALNYLVNKGKINSVAPGVLFYYSMVKAPSSSFTITITQTNDKAFPALAVQNGQIYLYNTNCNKSSAQGTTITRTDAKTGTQTITINVKGATAGTIYYLGIKYSPNSVVGKLITSPYPTVKYSYITAINGTAILTSQDYILLKPK